MIEDYFDGLLQELIISHAVSSFNVLKQVTGDEEGFIRIKCTLNDSAILEFAEYVTARRNRIHIETYSYHWQSADGQLIKRWDNVPHHKEVKTFPRHIHLTDDKVVSSPVVDIRKVLADIEKKNPVGND